MPLLRFDENKSIEFMKSIYPYRWIQWICSCQISIEAYCSLTQMANHWPKPQDGLIPCKTRHSPSLSSQNKGSRKGRESVSPCMVSASITGGRMARNRKLSVWWIFWILNLVAFPRGLKGLEGNRACYSYFVVHNYLLNQFCIQFSRTTIMAQEKAISCLW